MTPHLRTERLTLRPLLKSDATSLVRHLADWSVMRWLSAPPWPYTRTDADEFISAGYKAHWAIDDGTGLIGMISCADELGYWLAAEKQRKGFASEAASAVLTHHFSTQSATVTSGHMPNNHASRAVLTTHGFADTCVEPLLSRPLGRETDIQRMELTQERWHSLRTAAQ